MHPTARVTGQRRPREHHTMEISPPEPPPPPTVAPTTMAGATKGKPRASNSAGSGSYPIKRPTDEALLKPLGEAAASEDDLSGAAVARDTLARGVAKELLPQIDLLHLGLALQLAENHIALSDYVAHWGAACMSTMLSRAQFLYGVSGRVMAMSPPTRALPVGVGDRGSESRVFMLHYPPPCTAQHGFLSPDGQATCVTTIVIELAGQSAVPVGVHYPLACQFDIFTDLFECATDLEGVDGKPFSFADHYRATLTYEEKQMDITTKVDMLTSMFISERMLRNRSGAIAYIAGTEADEYAPALLQRAAEQATAILKSQDHAASDFLVRRPVNLPKVKRMTGSASRVDHPCMAFGPFMPMDKRKRNDACITEIQGGILSGVRVQLFEDLASGKSEERRYRPALLASEPYAGSYPPKNDAEKRALEAAVSQHMTRVGQLGRIAQHEVVVKAENGDPEAIARIKELKAKQKQSGSQNGKLSGKLNGKQAAKTKLSREAKDPKERVKGLNRRSSVKQRFPRILAEFTIEKLREDMKHGGGFTRGVRNYTADDLVLLKAHFGGGSHKCRIEKLQQQVIKLYKEEEG